MRIVVNDDDIESWIEYLELENEELKNNTIEYVVEQMKLYVITTLREEVKEEYLKPGSTLKR